MTEPVDALALGDGFRLEVVETPGGLSATPSVRTDDGRWRRAAPGDGVAAALLTRLTASPGTTVVGRFTLHGWAARIAHGERAIGVDQTNESVVVGDAAVVKWATHLQEGPHPAIRRIGVLRDAGFDGMPTPWGMVTWQPEGGTETVVATIDEFLPGAVDGWTWAVDLITEATRDGHLEPALAAATTVGHLIADLHAALASTTSIATAADAAGWRDAALQTLETACTVADSTSARLARSRHRDVASYLDGLTTLAGQPIIAGHGDLHVGQILRTAGRFVVTDFDGNPVLPAAQRASPIPAALDVAGMAQSLAHAAIVAQKYTVLDNGALAAVDTACRAAFLAGYTSRLAESGHSRLHDPTAVEAFRVQQVLREIIYAATHLPRWMYVPDAALPALLAEGTPA